MSGPAPLDAVLRAAFPGGVDRVQALSGGLTNANHRVWTPDGSFVVRRWTTDTGLLAIDREHERDATARAAAAGVAPELVAFLPDLQALVIAHVDGATLTAEAVRRGDRTAPIAEACRRLHAAEPFPGRFDMLALHARYRRLVDERGFRVPTDHDAYAGHLRRAAEALAVAPEPLVPCHNDLLAENLIDTGERIVLIDFEYAGQNEASFELGNLAAESDLDADALAALCAAYWGADRAGRVARARLWGTLARYGWSLWASIQAAVSPVDFDYRAWGTAKHDRALAAFEDPGFDALLDAVRAG